MQFYIVPEEKSFIEKNGKKVLLMGGFGGWWNLGDFLQLKSTVNLYRGKALPLILIHLQAMREDPDLLGRLKNLFPDTGIIICGNKDAENLEEVSFKLDILHLYGGGFLNEYWGRVIIEVLERAFRVFAPDSYIISGQQISRGVVSSFKKHTEIYQPELIGVRDEDSFDYLKEGSIPAIFSWDDAVDEIFRIKNTIKMGKVGSSEKMGILHINLSDYAIRDFGKIKGEVEFIIKRMKERIENFLLVNSYSRNSCIVKDTFKSIEFLELTRYIPFFKGLDLMSIVMNERFDILKEIFSSYEIIFACTSSYHTALLFSILGVPAYLFGFNEYYRQKHRAVMGKDMEFQYFIDNLEEVKRIQNERISRTLQRRKAFLKEMDRVLESASIYRDRERDFSYPLWPVQSRMPDEVDDYIRNLRKNLDDLTVEKGRIEEERKRLEDGMSRLRSDNILLSRELRNMREEKEKIEGELRNMREEKERIEGELHKIYNSRGWKVLEKVYTMLYKMKGGK